MLFVVNLSYLHIDIQGSTSFCGHDVVVKEQGPSPAPRHAVSPARHARGVVGRSLVPLVVLGGHELGVDINNAGQVMYAYRRASLSQPCYRRVTTCSLPSHSLSLSLLFPKQQQQ